MAHLLHSPGQHQMAGQKTFELDTQQQDDPDLFYETQYEQA